MGQRRRLRGPLLRGLGRFAAGTLGAFSFYLVGSMLVGGWPGLLPYLPVIVAVSAVVGLGQALLPPTGDTPDGTDSATTGGAGTPRPLGSGGGPPPEGSITWRPALLVRAGMLVVAVGLAALGGYLITVPGVEPLVRVLAVLGSVGLGIWTLSGIFLWVRLEPEHVVVRGLGWSTRRVPLCDVEAATAGPDGIWLRLRDGTHVLSRVVPHGEWRGPARPGRAVRIAAEIEAAAARLR